MAIYKLGDICQKIFVGKDMPESFGLEKSKLLNVPVVANGIGNSQIMGYTDNSITTEETISISARGTIGYVSFWTEPIHPIVRLLVIVPKNDIVLPKFLFYKLRLTNFLATGAVQKQLTKPDLEKITLEIPSLSEQQAIIDIIEPFASLIESSKKLLTNLNDQVRFFVSNSTKKSHLNEISQIKRYSKLIKSKDLLTNSLYFYSTGKTLSNNKMTNTFNFNDGISIAYEGAGIVDNDFLFPMLHNTPIYIGRKFGITSKFMYSIYFSLLFKNSNGIVESGVKMPTLSIEKLNSLVISCTTKEENQLLEQAFNCIKRIKLFIEKMENKMSATIATLIP